MIGNIPGIILLTAALVLLVLASVTAPVDKHLYFLKAVFNGASVAGVGTGRTQLNIGMWGYCVEFAGGSECSRRHLGIGISNLNYAGIPNQARISNAILNGLAKGLILHPIAAGITFIALLFALSTHVIVDILASFVAFLAFLTTLIVFIFDIVLFVTARHRLNDSVPGSPASLGNAFWMVMAALIAQFFAMFLVCFGGFKRRRERRYNNDAPPMRQQWWRRNRL